MEVSSFATKATGRQKTLCARRDRRGRRPPRRARAGAWLPPQVLGAGAVCWSIHPTAVEWANASATFEPHEILGVAWDVSERALRSAYRRLALEHHPDQGGCEETMARLNHARDVLCDPVLRRNHDRELDGV